MRWLEERSSALRLEAMEEKRKNLEERRSGDLEE
jgi:hypothetical protein